MATVRIYKVAELLSTTSQEVTALLKRDHGIEVKSASSTIEEVVARQFVERLAKQRGITLPSGDIFAETGAHAHHAPARGGAKKPAAGKKAPEPPKPAAPMLPPPRLVKTAKPAAVAAPATDASAAVDAAPPMVDEAHAALHAPEVEHEPVGAAEPPPVAQAPVAEPVAEARVRPGAEEPAPSSPVEREPAL